MMNSSLWTRKTGFRRLIVWMICFCMVFTSGIFTGSMFVEAATAENITNGSPSEGCNGEPVMKGYYQYRSMTGGTDKTDVFYYSDGYFAHDANDKNTTDNVHLHTLSMNLAMAAQGTNDGGSTSYKNKSRNLKNFLMSIGCEDFYANPDFSIKPDTTKTMGVGMAHKKVKLNNGEEFYLVPVGIRGGGYESEWASNVILGETGMAQGFNDSANKVLKEVESYVAEHLADVPKNQIKFWISGFSRAGAVSNIVSQRLTDNYSNKQVYGFCMEPPMAFNWSGKGYENIQLFVNPLDVVPFVAPTFMKFSHVGVKNSNISSVAEPYSYNYVNNTKYYWNNSKNKESANSNYKVDAMKTQLALINSDIEYSDPKNFAWASYSFYKKKYDSYDKGKKFGHSQNKFLEYLFEKLQAWSCADRAAWSTKKIEGKDTIENAISETFAMLYSVDSETKEKVMNSLTNFMGTLPLYFSTGLTQNDLLEWIRDDTDRLFTSQSKRYKHMYNPLWKKLNTDNKDKNYTALYKCFGYSSEAEAKANCVHYANLEKNIPVILYFARTFTTHDYEKKTNGQYQQAMGTLMYNLDSIAQAHYPEVDLAWIRTSDSYYSDTNANKVTYTSGRGIDIENATELKIYEYDEAALNKNDDKLIATYKNGGLIIEDASHNIGVAPHKNEPKMMKLYLPEDKSYTIHANPEISYVHTNDMERTGNNRNSNITYETIGGARIKSDTAYDFDTIAFDRAEKVICIMNDEERVPVRHYVFNSDSKIEDKGNYKYYLGMKTDLTITTNGTGIVYEKDSNGEFNKVIESGEQATYRWDDENKIGYIEVSAVGEGSKPTWHGIYGIEIDDKYVNGWRGILDANYDYTTLKIMTDTELGTRDYVANFEPIARDITVINGTIEELEKADVEFEVPGKTYGGEAYVKRTYEDVALAEITLKAEHHIYDNMSNEKYGAFHFANWNLGDENTEREVTVDLSDLSATASKTFAANYSESSKYQLTYVVPGSDDENVPVYINSKTELKTVTAPDGKIFVGWNVTKSNDPSAVIEVTKSGDSYSIVMPEYDVTATAVFEDIPVIKKYSVSVPKDMAEYVTLKGSEDKDITLTDGVTEGLETGTFIKATAKDRDGYNFVEWKTDGIMLIGANKQTVSFNLGSSNVTLTPVYEETEESKYPYELKTNDESFIASTFADGSVKTRYKEGETAVLRAPSIDDNGRVFFKWYTENSEVSESINTSSNEISFEMPAEDVEIIAQYTSVVSAPTTDIDVGSYNESKTIKLSTETEDAQIYYTIDGSVPDLNSNVYNEDEGIVLSAEAGKTKNYTIKAFAVKSGMKSSDVVSFTYIIQSAELYDVKVTNNTDSAEAAAAYNEAGAISDKFAEGEMVVLVAKEIEGKRFVKWTVSGIDRVYNETSATTGFTMPKGDVEVEANYVDVISDIAIRIEQPVAGEKLDVNPDVVGNGNEDLSHKLNWIPATSGNAEYGTPYSIMMELADTDKYVFDGNVEVIIDILDPDNREVTLKTVRGDASYNDGKLVIYCDDFEVTEKSKKVANIEAPDPVSVKFDTPVDSIPFPNTVKVNLTNEESVWVAVDWDKNTSDYKPTTAGEYKFTGSLQYPSDIDFGSYTNTEITVNVVANDAAVELVTATPEPGTYDETKTVELSTKTEGAEIYYTTDGSDPLDDNNQNRKKYEAGIEITETTVIKAYAVKDSASSAVTSFTYVITPPVDDTLYTLNFTYYDHNSGKFVTDKYQYKAGDTAYVFAMGSNKKAFKNWKVTETGGDSVNISSSDIVEGGLDENYFAFKMPAYDLDVEAVYSDLVTDFNLEFTEPVAGDTELANKASVTSINGHDYDDANGMLSAEYDIVWTPNVAEGKTVVGGEKYVAVITVEPADGQAISPSLNATVNNEDVNIVINTDGSATLTYVVEIDCPVVTLEYEDLDIYVNYGTSEEERFESLTRSIEGVTESGQKVMLPITWIRDSYEYLGVLEFGEEDDDVLGKLYAYIGYIDNLGQYQLSMTYDGEELEMAYEDDKMEVVEFVWEYKKLTQIKVDSDITSVDPELEKEGFKNVDQIKAALNNVVLKNEGYSEDDIAYFDVKMMYSVDGGETWEEMPKNEQPDKIEVTIDYPEKTNSTTHEFTAAHMFTDTDRAGQIEEPQVNATEDGIQLTLNGLSPIALGWKATSGDSVKLWGDANRDGKISPIDASLILQYYTKQMTEGELDVKVSDVNGDGKISPIDASLILQYYTKQIEKFPVEEHI